MSKISIIIKKARDPKRVLRLIMRQTAKWWSDEKYLRTYYYLSMGKKLNLANPRTFNEKLQWLKLYDKHEEYGKLVDKYEVKAYLQTIEGGVNY